MAFNWEATETQWYVDQENKMMRVQGHDPGDSIEESFRAYFN